MLMGHALIQGDETPVTLTQLAASTALQALVLPFETLYRGDDAADLPADMLNAEGAIWVKRAGT